MQIGNALGQNNLVNHYFGIGLLALGWFPQYPGSSIGFAIASAHNAPFAQRVLGIPAAETAFELSGVWAINHVLALQPDLQYIMGPSLGAHIPDAFVAMMRISVQFGMAA